MIQTRARWEELEEFPDYAVSDLGEVVNMKTGMSRKLSINQQGVCKVSLYSKNRLLTRSVAVLVADAFVPRLEAFHDTPIHLDGDRQNCTAENLMWRPRWFAIMYHKQFHFETFHDDMRRFVDVNTGEQYHGIKEVCTTHGLYYFDVDKSCVEGTFTPFTYQEFRVL